MKKLFCLILLCAQAQAATWYSSPSATAGSGSIGDPWRLGIALTNNSILPGDTLYLRGGTYSGNFRSTLSGVPTNYITVRSYTNEWAVITDGAFGGLANSVGPSGTSFIITNSFGWLVNQTVIVDNEQVLLWTLSNGTNWTVVRGWNGTIAATHCQGIPVIPRQSLLEQTGNNVLFRDFELTSVQSTNRVLGNNWYVSPGINLTPGSGNKVVNLIIHNVGHPAVGFWNQGTNSEISGCVFWGNGFYDTQVVPGDWIRGTAIYAQNITGNPVIKNNISFRNFTENMQAYGTAASTKGFRFINNITMMSPNGFGIGVWNAEVPMDDNAMWTNYHALDGQIWGYTSVSNRGMSSVGNVLVKSPVLFIKNHLTGVFTNNTFLFDRNISGVNEGMLGFQYLDTNSSAISFNIDRNTYYNTNGDAYVFSYRTKDVTALASDGSGRLKWIDGTNSWSAWTGYDTHSSWTQGWPTNYLKIDAFPTDYDTNIIHLVVVSTSGQTNAAWTPTWFMDGDRYTLRDAQDYFHPISTGVTYTTGPINLPLNLTNVASIYGSLTHYTNVHTNVRFPKLFNSFVISRTPLCGN